MRRMSAQKVLERARSALDWLSGEEGASSWAHLSVLYSSVTVRARTLLSRQ